MSKQIIKSVLYSLVVVWVVSLGSPIALAQLPPALSPWLHMADRPRSDLGNYLGVVKPQQNLMKSSASQSNQIQQQQRALQELLRAPASSGTGIGSSARNLGSATGNITGGATPTGGAPDVHNVLAPPREIPKAQKNPAGFNQYLHYYPQYAMPRRPVPDFSSIGSPARRR